MVGAYSGYQVELSDKIIALRDEQQLTYKQIADSLTAEGYRSPRGFGGGAGRDQTRRSSATGRDSCRGCRAADSFR